MASIDRLSPLLALGVGVLHAGLSPVLVVSGVAPNLVLGASVILAAMSGPIPALIVAFGGGLAANLYAPEPIGTLPLVLVAVTALVALGARLLGGPRAVYAVAAVFPASILTELATAVVAALAAGSWPIPPMDVTLRGAALTSAMAAMVVMAISVVSWRRRRPALA